MREAGFPPPLISETSHDESPLPTKESYVRIGSVDLSGGLRAVIRSRPLNRELCPPWEISLDTFDEWNAELQRMSNLNLVETGRRGCTSTQLYDWVGRYVIGARHCRIDRAQFGFSTAC